MPPGTGYFLTITKSSESASFSSEDVLSLVQKYVSRAEVRTDNVGEMNLSLDVAKTEVLPDLAQALDANRTRLGFLNFGFSKTTMEDVFLKVGEEKSEANGPAAGGWRGANALADEESLDYFSEDMRLTGLSLLLSHFKGLFVKRMFQTFRMWKTYVFLNLFSLAIVVILAVFANVPLDSSVAAAPVRSVSTFSYYPGSVALVANNYTEGGPLVSFPGYFRQAVGGQVSFAVI